MLVAADQAFFVLHTALIVFNCIGWAWEATRPWQLATLAATAFSWFVLGARYGWGYCVCTDWHFAVRRRLGYLDPDDSYLQLLARHWFGWTLDLGTANLIAGTVFATILIATATVWLRSSRR